MLLLLTENCLTWNHNVFLYSVSGPGSLEGCPIHTFYDFFYSRCLLPKVCKTWIHSLCNMSTLGLVCEFVRLLLLLGTSRYDARAPPVCGERYCKTGCKFCCNQY